MKTYLNFEEIEGFSKIVKTDEVLKNDAKLSIPLYVKPKKDESEKKPLKELIAEWQQSSKEVRNSMNDMFETLEEAGVTK